MHKRIEREIVGGPQPFANYGVPCYGERGRLSFVGTKKVQCHVCGKYFQFLGLHVVKTHEMTCDHYRESFGLPHDTGLVCIALHERFGNVHGPRLAKLKDYARARSREAISQLEHDDSWVAKRAAKASAKQGGRAWLVLDCVICGREYRCLSNSPRLTCEGNGSACDSERRRRNATGKGHSEESKAAMRAAKLKPALHFDCHVCGTHYTTSASRPRRTCSPACAHEAIVRWHTGRTLSDETKNKIRTKAAERRAIAMRSSPPQ